MEYKDFIKPGNKVVYIPDDNAPWFAFELRQVVTIGEYRPYYTDGRPDPKPEEYDETCQVEIEEDIDGECQIPLANLHAIIPLKEQEEVVVGTKIGTLIAYVDYESEDLFVIDIDGEWKVFDSTDWDYRMKISDLAFDELVELRKQVCVGSMYIGDYTNCYGIPPSELCTFCDGYLEFIEEEGYKDTPEEFANYLMGSGI